MNSGPVSVSPHPDHLGANRGVGTAWMGSRRGGGLRKGVWHTFSLNSLKAGLRVTAYRRQSHPPSLQQGSSRSGGTRCTCLLGQFQSTQPHPANTAKPSSAGTRGKPSAPHPPPLPTPPAQQAWDQAERSLGSDLDLPWALAGGRVQPMSAEPGGGEEAEQDLGHGHLRLLRLLLEELVQELQLVLGGQRRPRTRGWHPGGGQQLPGRGGRHRLRGLHLQRQRDQA